MTQLNQYGQRIGFALPDWRPLAAPAEVVLKGQFCRLEPLRVAHAPALFSAFSCSGDDRDWTWLVATKPTSLGEMKHWIVSKTSNRELVSYAVVDKASQQAMGVVCFANIDGQNGVIEIGHVIWSPLMQRTVLGSEALFLLLRQAFRLGYRRVAWRCDSTNCASRRAAERLGFIFEGRLRQAMIRKQHNRDTDWLSIIDGEWPGVERALEAWLSPKNMDNNGRQRQKLAAFFAAET